jgi:hypothetical protein
MEISLLIKQKICKKNLSNRLSRNIKFYVMVYIDIVIFADDSGSKNYIKLDIV